METFSALLALCEGNCRHKAQWRGALMLYLICAWTNGWAKNRDTGDYAHHDVNNEAPKGVSPSECTVVTKAFDMFAFQVFPAVNYFIDWGMFSLGMPRPRGAQTSISPDEGLWRMES